MDHLDELHSLLVTFIRSYLAYANERDLQDDFDPVLAGVITSYVPEFLGDQLLYWSGQYWERTHPVFSGRTPSKDLVDTTLSQKLDELLVLSPHPFLT